MESIVICEPACLRVCYNLKDHHFMTWWIVIEISKHVLVFTSPQRHLCGFMTLVLCTCLWQAIASDSERLSITYKVLVAQGTQYCGRVNGRLSYICHACDCDYVANVQQLAYCDYIIRERHTDIPILCNIKGYGVFFILLRPVAKNGITGLLPGRLPVKPEATLSAIRWLVFPLCVSHAVRYCDQYNIILGRQENIEESVQESPARWWLMRWQLFSNIMLLVCRKVEAVSDSDSNWWITIASACYRGPIWTRKSYTGSRLPLAESTFKSQ